MIPAPTSRTALAHRPKPRSIRSSSRVGETSKPPAAVRSASGNIKNRFLLQFDIHGFPNRQSGPAIRDPLSPSRSSYASLQPRDPSEKRQKQIRGPQAQPDVVRAACRFSNDRPQATGPNAQRTAARPGDEMMDPNCIIEDFTIFARRATLSSPRQTQRTRWSKSIQPQRECHKRVP